MTIMHAISRSLFRAYDIRGVYNENLTENSARLIGQAIGSELRDKGEQQIVIGRDGRLSSPSLSKAVITGLRQTGCNVIDLGMVPTPVLYFAVQTGIAPHGAMITGSHNPPDQNGIKIVIHGESQYNHQIQRLYERIIRHELRSQTQLGTLSQQEILNTYQQHISTQVQLERPLKVAIDCGNGATAMIATQLFQNLGCEVYPLFAEVDGRFPNHSPDPTQPENLRPLCKLVTQQQLDIGIAFDGDGDRMIAVDNNGHILWPDRILMLLAQSVLSSNPNRVVAYDVKCTYKLDHIIKQAGGQPEMCISGHSLLKKFIKEQNAVLGGEFSGHIVLRDRGMEYDDGMYIAARLLETLATQPLSTAQVFQQIPEGFSTPEHKLCFDSYEAAHAAMHIWQQDHQLQAEHISMLDGIRAEYKDGWGLARASNTCPCITLRFEAETEQRLEAIQALFRAEIHRLNLTRSPLPF